MNDVTRTVEEIEADLDAMEARIKHVELHMGRPTIVWADKPDDVEDFLEERVALLIEWEQALQAQESRTLDPAAMDDKTIVWKKLTIGPTYSMGHPIVMDDLLATAYYLDTGEQVPGDPCMKRPCAHCGKSCSLGSDVDPCLGKLPGVKNACCGHGVREGYIQFDNDVLIRFEPVSVGR